MDNIPVISRLVNENHLHIDGGGGLNLNPVGIEGDIENHGVGDGILLPAEGTGGLGHIGVVLGSAGENTGDILRCDGRLLLIGRNLFRHDAVALNLKADERIGELLYSFGVVALDGLHHVNTVNGEEGGDDADVIGLAGEIIVKEDQVAGFGGVFTSPAEETHGLETVDPGEGTGVSRHEVIGHLAIVQAEGDEHGAPVLIREAVPLAVTGDAELRLFAGDLVLFDDEVGFTLGITQLRLGDGKQPLVIGQALQGHLVQAGHEVPLRLQIRFGIRLAEINFLILRPDRTDDIADIGRLRFRRQKRKGQQTCSQNDCKQQPDYSVLLLLPVHCFPFLVCDAEIRCSFRLVKEIFMTIHYITCLILRQPAFCQFYHFFSE